jgi:hypothetical protein
MMRTLAAMLVSVSLVGCAATSADGEQSSSSTAKLGTVSAVGTFRASELSPGVYESITFLANGTYRAAAVARCGTSDCAARLVVAIEGTWTSDARGGLSAQVTLRPTNIPRPPLFDDHGGAYIVTHELAHASLNYVDEYSEPGLETNRLPTPATPFGGAPGYRLDHLAGGCTDDNACVNTVCEQGAPQCTAFGACGCAITTVIEAN